jgi:2-dehydropantoate 2-reductase
MRYIIYGAGGIGSVIGGHLFRHGADVVMVGNAQHVDAIRARGLTLVTGDHTFTLTVPSVKTASELVPFRASDVVLLCAKSQQTVRCLGQLRAAGAPSTLPIFCCQNSIWNEPVATRMFDNVYGVMILLPAFFMTPGIVVNTMIEQYGQMDIGRYPRGIDALAEDVSKTLRDACFIAATHAEVMLPKGVKCLHNLANALDAIIGGREGAREFVLEAQREAKQIWSAAGIGWEEPDSFLQRTQLFRKLQKTPPGYEEASGKSSSWQSLARGTGNIEAEQLNGDVAALGRLLGIAAPYNELLWRVAVDMARAGDPPGKYTLADLTTRVGRPMTMGVQ